MILWVSCGPNCGFDYKLRCWKVRFAGSVADYVDALGLECFGLRIDGKGCGFRDLRDSRGDSDDTVRTQSGLPKFT